MSLSTEVDKTKIDVTVYLINENTTFHTYTATWCKPCTRIKPKVIEIMSKLNHKVLSQEIIEKEIFKKTVNQFVPFFVIKAGDNNDTIQTSEELLLIRFLNKNGINTLVLDDDF